MINRFFKRDSATSDIHEFKPLLIEIQDRPANPLGRIILYLVTATLLFGVLWMIFAKVDVVVSATGKVIPDGEIKILKPLESGIISKIFVKEGDRVSKNQTLIQIDPSVTDSSLSTKQNDLSVIKQDIKLYEALISQTELSSDELNLLNHSQQGLYLEQREILINTHKSNQTKLEAIKLEINSNNSELKRLNLLLDKEEENKQRLEAILDIIAKKDYNEVLKNIISLKEQTNMAKFKLSESKKRYEEIEKQSANDIKNIKSRWLEISLDKQRQARELTSQIDAIVFANKQQQIKSPVDGYVGKLLIHTEGGAVTPNDNLISIVPSNTPLIIKANVLNKDIGFLKVGQEVAIKIDTFSFQKYGLLKGKLISISNDALEDERLGLIYEIKISPLNLEINVDGENKKLDIGMSTINEIKIGKRRVIELFIYPIIKYLDEGVKVR